MKPKHTSQKPDGGGKSHAQGTAVGSGSRPGGGKIPIATSAPSDKGKMHRGGSIRKR